MDLFPGRVTNPLCRSEHLEINLSTDLNITVLSASLPLFEVFTACNGTEVPKENRTEARENIHMGTADFEYTGFSLSIFLLCSKLATLSWKNTVLPVPLKCTG